MPKKIYNISFVKDAHSAALQSHLSSWALSCDRKNYKEWVF